jgi:hypothetical protein
MALSEKELLGLGRRAAMRIMGASAVKEVVVTMGQESVDQDAYFFSFLIDGDVGSQPLSELHIRLSQEIRDRLIARHDYTYPFVEFREQLTPWRPRTFWEGLWTGIAAHLPWLLWWWRKRR